MLISTNIRNRAILFSLAIVMLFLLPGPAASVEYSEPYSILKSYYKAIGGLEKLDEIQTSYSEGETRLDGLKGTFKHWEKRPIKYRTEENYTAISQMEGDTGKIPWFLDTNGQLLIHKDEETLKRREISKRLDRYEHLIPDSPYFSLSLSGVSDILDRQCYEIILSNTINRDITHFFIDPSRRSKI